MQSCSQEFYSWGVQILGAGTEAPSWSRGEAPPPLGAVGPRSWSPVCFIHSDCVVHAKQPIYPRGLVSGLYSRQKRREHHSERCCCQTIFFLLPNAFEKRQIWLICTEQIVIYVQLSSESCVGISWYCCIAWCCFPALLIERPPFQTVPDLQTWVPCSIQMYSWGLLPLFSFSSTSVGVLRNIVGYGPPKFVGSCSSDQSELWTFVSLGLAVFPKFVQQATSAFDSLFGNSAQSRISREKKQVKRKLAVFIAVDLVQSKVSALDYCFSRFSQSRLCSIFWSLFWTFCG